MHMQNGLTLEQREWIRAEIACALESRPAAPTSKADELLREVVEAYKQEGLECWFEVGAYVLVPRALTAAREYVEAQGKATAPPPTTGEREVPVTSAILAALSCFASDGVAVRDSDADTIEAAHAEFKRLRQRAPLSPETKGEGTVDK